MSALYDLLVWEFLPNARDEQIRKGYKTKQRGKQQAVSDKQKLMARAEGVLVPALG